MTHGVYRVNALALDPNHLGIMLCVPILLLLPFALRRGRAQPQRPAAGGAPGVLRRARGAHALALGLPRAGLRPRRAGVAVAAATAAGARRGAGRRRARARRARARLLAVCPPGHPLARDAERQLGQGALPVLRPRDADPGLAPGLRPRPQHVLGLLPVPDRQDELGAALVLHRAPGRDRPGRRRRVRGVPDLGGHPAGRDPAGRARAAPPRAIRRPPSGARWASA